VVQDAFLAMHEAWQRLRDAEKALAYLRQTVVNRSRSVLRHRTVVDKNLQKAPPDMPSAEHGALVLLERSAVVAALLAALGQATSLPAGEEDIGQALGDP
jgi:DNA-directed RNA polymerase specialized sigma24 family protein